jgi:hypothetical protein
VRFSALRAFHSSIRRTMKHPPSPRIRNGNYCRNSNPRLWGSILPVPNLQESRGQEYWISSLFGMQLNFTDMPDECSMDSPTKRDSVSGRTRSIVLCMKLEANTVPCAWFLRLVHSSWLNRPPLHGRADNIWRYRSRLANFVILLVRTDLRYGRWSKTGWKPARRYSPVAFVCRTTRYGSNPATWNILAR